MRRYMEDWRAPTSAPPSVRPNDATGRGGGSYRQEVFVRYSYVHDPGPWQWTFYGFVPGEREDNNARQIPIVELLCGCGGTSEGLRKSVIKTEHRRERNADDDVEASVVRNVAHRRFLPRVGLDLNPNAVNTVNTNFTARYPGFKAHIKPIEWFVRQLTAGPGGGPSAVRLLPFAFS
jgi:hypothetical protein